MSTLPIPQNGFHSLNVQVNYQTPIQGDEDLIQRVANIGKAQVATWYLGRKGLREDWLAFLRDRLITPLRNSKALARCVLVDLRAWEILKDPTKDLKPDPAITSVDKLRSFDLETLNTKDFFLWLKNMADPECLTYAHETILKRPFIWAVSEETQQPAGRTLQVACQEASVSGRPLHTSDGGGSFALLSPIGDKDISLAYSALQYLEGIFLVQKMFERVTRPEPSSEAASPIRRQNSLRTFDADPVNIIFLLPNDEDKYYRSPDDAFAQDIAHVLACNPELPRDRPIRVFFIPFRFGTQPIQRPYLSDGPKVKPEALKTLKADDSWTLASPAGSEPDASPVAGSFNYNAQQHYAFGDMIRKAKQAFAAHGFTPFHAEPLVSDEEHQKSCPPGSQCLGVAISQHDGIAQTWGMPFDHAVSLAQCIEAQPKLDMPYRRADLSLCYRCQPPRPGKPRAFYQADINTVGHNLNTVEDFECLAAVIRALKEMGIGPFTVHIGHSKFVNGETMPGSQVANELALLQDMVSDAGFTQLRWQLRPNFSSPESATYSGLFFEIFLDGLEQYGRIAVGGRKPFPVSTDSELQTVHGSIDITYLFDILNREGKISNTRSTSADALVCYRDPSLIQTARKVADVLRSHGVFTEMYTGNSEQLKKQLDFAQKKGIPKVAIVMDDKAIIVKHLSTKADKDNLGTQVDAVESVWSAYQCLNPSES